jgi:hypothetical protein
MNAPRLGFPSDRNGVADWRPGRLWSLWDIMRRFSVAQLLAIAAAGGLSGARIEFDKHFPVKPDSKSNMLEESNVVKFIESHESVAQACIDLELTCSLATIRKIQEMLRSPNPSYTKLHPLDLELQNRLIDETFHKVFWALSIRESELYDNPRKGWKEIIEHFPDTVTDIEEASKCFALSRYAAAIFHSVQVVEVGLIELGKLIGVADPLSGWTATTNRLQSIIKKGHEARTPFERQHFSFFEQMHGTIEGLKNAWRNKISHAQAKLILLTADFSPDVAEEILFATRAFMRRLAEGLPPKSP